MNSLKSLFIVAAIFIGVGMDFTFVKADQLGAEQGKSIKSADQGSNQSKETWRYTYHNGEWWYWLPSNRWVYWRGNLWNDYTPRTFISLNASRSTQSAPTGTAMANQASANSDIRPFYGHAISDLDRRPLERNNEVGPFYGHTLPTEVYGTWRERRSIRPFYGHAISAYDY